jgi:hypothetical protein
MYYDTAYHENRKQYSVVGIVSTLQTGHYTKESQFHSQLGQNVLKFLNWHWYLPSLLFSGIQGHFIRQGRGKGGGQAMKVHFYLVPRLTKNAAKPLTSWTSWILHSMYRSSFSFTFIYCGNVFLVLGKQIHVCCNSINKNIYYYACGTIRRYSKLSHCLLRQTQMQILFTLSPV